MLNLPNLPGLQERIAASGYWVRTHFNGVGTLETTCSDEVAVQAIIDGYTVAEAQAAVCKQIDAVLKGKFDAVIGGYSPGEMAGWAVMRDEALAYQADPLAVVPNLTAEAATRGCSVGILASKVLANAATLIALRSSLMGTAGRHKDAIRALPTREQVAAYDWREGWPV